MTGLLYFLIIFFLFLIIYQLFLAYSNSFVEGLTNNTSTTTPSTTTPSTTTPSTTTPSTTTPSTTTPSTSGTGSVTTATTSVSPSTSSSSINTSSTNINAAAINSDNIAYQPYTSTSQTIPSLVGQNTNNILYLKTNFDNLFQQVQDISGNLTAVSNVQTSQSSQMGKVSDVVNQTQTQIQQVGSSKPITGLN